MKLLISRIRNAIRKLRNFQIPIISKNEFKKISRRSRSLGSGFIKYNSQNLTQDDVKRVKHIALYLTQFHPMKENNEWWGKNFTEWNNVTKATPQFVDHYQPHLPHDIGFYNLLDKETWLSQIEMAKNYGIYGFCFYFYWFNGVRLLEKPLDLFLNNQDLNMPFCLFWANDSWTRTWHGFSDHKNTETSERQVLMPQNHNEDDDIIFIDHLLDIYFNDARYIRVNNKPLLVIYHTHLFPDIKKTASTFKERAAKKNQDIFLMYVLMPGQENEPLIENFDAAMQFSPLNTSRRKIKPKRLNPEFDGTAYSYQKTMISEISRSFDIPIARCCFPSWDNEARRPTKGISYQGSTPALFEEYLVSMNKYSLKNPLEGESIVFINAWNEWAEGAHLEPDRQFGYAWLQAVSNAIKKRGYTTKSSNTDQPHFNE